MFGKLLLLCGSALFTCLAAEAFLRIFPQDETLLYDPRILWNHWKEPNLPGDNKEYFPNFYNERYKYDKVIGYERKEIAERIQKIREARPESFKILLLGDSITEITTYAGRFEHLLHNEFGSNKIDVVNSGVIGYDA